MVQAKNLPFFFLLLLQIIPARADVPSTMCSDAGCLPWKESRRERGHHETTSCLVNRTDSYRTVPWPQLLMYTVLFHTYTEQVETQNHTCYEGHSGRGWRQTQSTAWLGKRFWKVASPRLGLEAEVFEPTLSPQTHTYMCAHSFLTSPLPTPNTLLTIMNCLKIRPKQQCLLCR